MQTNEFERAFEVFMESREYDEAQNALFAMIRKSFEAGWLSAGGEPSIPHRIFEVVQDMQDDAESKVDK